MYTQFVISLIGIRNEVNPLAHLDELRKIYSMILDAAVDCDVTLEQYYALLDLHDEIAKEIDEFNRFIWWAMR